MENMGRSFYGPALERSHVTFAHTPLERTLSHDHTGRLRRAKKEKGLDFAAKIPQPEPETNICCYVDLMSLLILFEYPLFLLVRIVRSSAQK